jgi:non-specific serine/threonine protein kinase
MLETVRQFAAEHLAASGETEAVRARHTDYFLALAEWPSPAGPPGSEWNQTVRDAIWFERIRADYENIRAVMRRLIEHDDLARGLRLGVVLRLYWALNGFHVEGRTYLADLLRRAEGRHDLDLERAWGTRAAGQLARVEGTVTEARALCETSLACFRRLNHSYGIGHVLMNLGLLAQLRGEYAEASRLYAESLSLFEEIGDEHGVAFVTTWMGTNARDAGDLEAAAHLLEAADRQWRLLDGSWMQSVAKVNLGALRYLQGDDVQARTLIEEGLGGLAKFGVPFDFFLWVALLDLAQGRHDAARVRLHASLDSLAQAGDAAGACTALEALAQVAAVGEPELALRLAGAAASHREQFQVPQALSLRRKFEGNLQRARQALGGKRAAAAWAAGRSLTLDDAVAEALRASEAPFMGHVTATPSPSGAAGALTRREIEVLRLVAMGRSNREIGATLAVSVHTVERHVATIYRKIDAGNRADATAYAIRHGLA